MDQEYHDDLPEFTEAEIDTQNAEYDEMQASGAFDLDPEELAEENVLAEAWLAEDTEEDDYV